MPEVGERERERERESERWSVIESETISQLEILLGDVDRPIRDSRLRGQASIKECAELGEREGERNADRRQLTGQKLFGKTMEHQKWIQSYN